MKPRSDEGLLQSTRLLQCFKRWLSLKLPRYRLLIITIIIMIINRVLLPPSQAKSLEATHERGFAGLQTREGGQVGGVHSTAKEEEGDFLVVEYWVGGVMECKSQQQTSQPLKCRFLPSGNIQDCTEAIFLNRPHKDYTMRRWQPRSRSAKAEMQ